MKPIIEKGDIVEWAKTYDGEPFHALISDPPYHLQSIVKRFGKKGSAPARHGADGAFSRASAGFMGKVWDGGDISFDPETWHLIGQHLYPGAFGMAFSSARGWHRMAVAIEDAGFIIHPMIGWVYGSGFGKATRIDNQIDRMLGKDDGRENQLGTEVPATELAKAWEGHRYGLQALNPSLEPVICFQKPYEGRPVENMMETGAGALNIDGGRIALNGDYKSVSNERPSLTGLRGTYDPDNANKQDTKGRWPKNCVLTHHPACRIVGETEGDTYTINRFTDGAKPFGNGAGHDYESEDVDGGKQLTWACHPDCSVRRLGEQARYYFQADWSYEILEQLKSADPVYYCSKVSQAERNAGLDQRNGHPTLKPLDLIRYLSTLLLPPDIYAPRRILVPFAGVASEMIACMLAGWEYVHGIELDSDNEYIDIAEKRIEWWHNWMSLGYTDPKEIIKIKPPKKDPNQLEMFE